MKTPCKVQSFSLACLLMPVYIMHISTYRRMLGGSDGGYSHTHAQGPTFIQLHEETCRDKTPEHSSSVLQEVDKLFFNTNN